MLKPKNHTYRHNFQQKSAQKTKYIEAKNPQTKKYSNNEIKMERTSPKIPLKTPRNRKPTTVCHKIYDWPIKPVMSQEKPNQKEATMFYHPCIITFPKEEKLP